MPDILSKAAMHNAYFICHNVQVKLLSIKKCSTGLLTLNMSKYFLYHICRTWCFTEVLHGMGQGEKEKGKKRNKCKERKIQESKEWEIALPLWPTILVFQVVHLFQNSSLMKKIKARTISRGQPSPDRKTDRFHCPTPLIL